MHYSPFFIQQQGLPDPITPRTRRSVTTAMTSLMANFSHCDWHFVRELHPRQKHICAMSLKPRIFLRTLFDTSSSAVSYKPRCEITRPSEREKREWDRQTERERKREERDRQTERQRERGGDINPPRTMLSKQRYPVQLAVGRVRAIVAAVMPAVVYESLMTVV